MMYESDYVAGWGYIENSAAHRAASISFDSHKLKATCYRRPLSYTNSYTKLNGEHGYIYWLYMVHYPASTFLS
jgi:hypothetical protein